MSVQVRLYLHGDEVVLELRPGDEPMLTADGQEVSLARVYMTPDQASSLGTDLIAAAENVREGIGTGACRCPCSNCSGCVGS